MTNTTHRVNLSSKDCQKPRENGEDEKNDIIMLFHISNTRALLHKKALKVVFGLSLKGISWCSSVLRDLIFFCFYQKKNVV